MNNVYIRQILTKEINVSPKAFMKWKQDFYDLFSESVVRY